MPAAWVFPLGSAAALALAAKRYRWPRPGAGRCWRCWYALAPPLPDLFRGLRLAVLRLGSHLGVAAALYLGERQEQVLFHSLFSTKAPTTPPRAFCGLGYADTATGRVVLVPRYEAAFPFASGRARVGRRCRLRTDGNHSWGNCAEWAYINHQGQPWADTTQ